MDPIENPSDLLHRLRAHLEDHPIIYDEPLLLHERGGIYSAIRDRRAYQVEGHRSFRRFCNAVSSQRCGGYGSALAAIDIYKGYSAAELQGVDAPASLLVQLLDLPVPRRRQLLTQIVGLHKTVAKAVIRDALREAAAPQPAPAKAPFPPLDQLNPLEKLVAAYLQEHEALMAQAGEVHRRWDAGEPMHQNLLVLLKHAALERRTLYELLADSLAGQAAVARAEGYGGGVSDS